MKRRTGLAVILALLLCLSACGGKSKQSAGGTGSGSPQISGQSERDDSQTGGSQGELPSEPETEASIGETVLVDEGGIKITAKGLSMDELFGPELKLLIENNSGQNLTFQCRNGSVNGYMIDTLMSADVLDGKKANDGLIFYQTSLDLCGITTIADLEFSFHIFTTEGWDTYLDTPQIQLQTSAADSYDYTYGIAQDSFVYEGDDIRIAVRGLSTSMFGPEVILYIENNSDQAVTIQARNESVNGFMVSSLFSCDVLAGKHAVDSITFMSSELVENGITEMEIAEWSFHIFNMDSWSTIADTEQVSVPFPPGLFPVT